MHVLFSYNLHGGRFSLPLGEVPVGPLYTCPVFGLLGEALRLSFGGRLLLRPLDDLSSLEFLRGGFFPEPLLAS